MLVALLVALLVASTPPIRDPALATETADRINPPTTIDDRFAPAGLTGCDEFEWYRVKWGLPERFRSLAWRESNCRNEDEVRTFCCYGWLQLHVYLHLRDHRLAPRYALCGIDSHHDINSDTPIDKWRQMCAARAVFDVVGYSAWSL